MERLPLEGMSRRTIIVNERGFMCRTAREEVFEAKIGSPFTSDQEEDIECKIGYGHQLDKFAANPFQLLLFLQLNHSTITCTLPSRSYNLMN